MKSVSTLPSNNNWKRINLPLASFAGGLALATAAILGGGEVLRDGGDARSTSSTVNVASRYVGVAMAEPAFGSTLADYAAFRQPSAARFGSGSVGPAMDEPDFGSLAIEYVGPAMDEPDFGYLGIEAAPVAVDLHFSTPAESVSAIEGDYLR